RLAARLHRRDQRAGHARADGWPESTDARQPRVRRGPDLDELAVRAAHRRNPIGRHRRRNARLPAHDARPGAPERPGMRGRALFAVVVAIYLFLLAPLLIVVAVSFDPTDAFRFPPPGVSLRWYAAFFASDTFMRAFFRVSLVIAAVVSVAATVIGGLAAVGRVPFLGRRPRPLRPPSP